jgi:putative intracellular protease/amidase
MTQIGFVFIQGFADWEFGHLAGAAVEWFDAKAVALTPEGKPVVSIGGFSLSGQRGLSAEENEDLDAVAVIGSDTWAAADPPDLRPLLSAVAGRGGVVGGICAGTLPLARAGLFAERAHTSNGGDWIRQLLPDYAGAAYYRDVPHAVADRGIISAPGSAPGTFAVAFLSALYPDRPDQLDQMQGFIAREFQDASGTI